MIFPAGTIHTSECELPAHFRIPVHKSSRSLRPATKASARASKGLRFFQDV